MWAPVLVLSAGLSLSVALTFDGGGWLAVPMAVLGYPAGRRMTSVPLALRVFGAVLCTGLALALWRSPDPFADWLSVLFVEFSASVLPWSLGRYQRLRAEQREHERAAVAEQARLRERERIARDVHDSIGHELALIALHGGALELAADLTDEQKRAAGEVRAGAVRATHRLHDIVQVFGGAASLRPADESIDDLVRRASQAGLRVRLRHVGTAPAWSPMTRQAAHRVVQESLTNATRHAPGAPVTVTIARRDDGTRVEVVNEPAARSDGGTGTGLGLIGLAERVRLAGGRLSAGPRPDGGWAVTAVLADGTGPWRDAGPPDPAPDGRRWIAAPPLGVGLALVVVLAVLQVVTVTRTGLADDRFADLRSGLTRADVDRLLPPDDLGPAPRVLATPPRPEDASCVYYLAGDNLLDLDPDAYQLCFVDDVLVAKNRLERA
ncbi:signal transduction histidine kinase [Umezawaea tangerina]|uniref:histidine kinase n=1 Tax=Umezawaea tangerina TaxID=84725 RepID=A0A2T0T6Q2_9PSEU|nr:signal transduction histidine kinase [Umezawaea tangerina]